MRIKGIWVQQINPINLPWPFSSTHYTSHGQHATSHHQASSLWRTDLATNHPADHGLALWGYSAFWQEGSYPVIWLWTLPNNLQGNLPLHFCLKKHGGRFFRSPRTPSTGSWRRERMQKLLTNSGGVMCIWTCSLMIGSGHTWSEGPNSFVMLIRPRSMIWPCYLFSGWGSWIGRLLMIVSTKQHKWSGTEPLWHSVSYPGYWLWNPRWKKQA